MMVDDEPLIRKIVKMEMNERAARVESGDLDSTVVSQVEMVDTFGDGGALLAALENARLGGRLPGLRMRTPGIFERPKVLSRQTADRIVAACDSAGRYYYANTLHGTAPRPGTYSLHFLAAVMNSAAVERWYRIVASESGKPFPQVKIAILKRLPVCRASRQEQCAVLRALRRGGASAADPMIDRLYGL